MTDNSVPTYSVNWEEGSGSDGEIAAELATAYFEDPMPWQRGVLRVMLARAGDGKLLHQSLGFAGPRQNGKSWVVRARCMYGITILGERVLYTCHNQDTADTMRAAFSKPFEDKRSHPELYGKSVVRKTNGQGWVSYSDPRTGVEGYIFFTTRSTMKSLGTTWDIVVYDEAQELTRGQQKTSLPAISAGKREDPQAIYIGTPEDEDSHGDVLPMMRRRAREGSGRSAWAEWALECSVSELAQEVGDRDIWRRVNPGWDYIVNHSAVEGEFDGMDPREFATMRLGWWMPDGIDAGAEALIPEALWEDTAIQTMEGFPDVRRAFGLKFSRFDGTWALAGCAVDKDGMAAFELVEVGGAESNLRSLADQLAKRKSAVSCVLMDGMPGASIVMEALGQSPRGYAVEAATKDMASACGMLMQELDDGTAAHVSCEGQRVLDSAATSVEKRKIGNSGGWGFDGPGYVVMEACALALWAARNSKRDPRRRQVIL